MLVEAGTQGGGSDACVWKSIWREIHDSWIEGLLHSLETISHAERSANILRDVADHENHPRSGKNHAGAWTFSFLNSLSRSLDACAHNGL